MDDQSKAKWSFWIRLLVGSKGIHKILWGGRC